MQFQYKIKVNQNNIMNLFVKIIIHKIPFLENNITTSLIHYNKPVKAAILRKRLNCLNYKNLIKKFNQK